MKAILIEKPGHFEIVTLETPKPAPDEILVEMKVFALCNQHDWKVNLGLYRENIYLDYGTPGFPGHEGAGIVAEIGKEVTGFKIGDHVVLSGLGGPPLYAQYVTRKPDSVARVSKNVPLEYVAMAELFGCVHRAVQKVKNYQGKKVLVSGVGPAGLAALQLAKISGAQQVIVTDLRPQRLALARELGADEIIDVENEKYLAEFKKIGFDIVIECSGNKTALQNAFEIAREEIVIFGYSEGAVELPLWNLFDRELTIHNSKWLTTDDLQQVVNYVEKGKLITAPLISAVVDFNDYKKAVEMVGNGDVIKVLMTP